jgi:hypothetical protein
MPKPKPLLNDLVDRLAHASDEEALRLLRNATRSLARAFPLSRAEKARRAREQNRAAIRGAIRDLPIE